MDVAYSPRRLNYWPAMLDLVTATLMVFLMVTFLQTLLSAEELEALIVRGRQEQFLELFHAEFEKEIGQGVVAVDRELNFLQITFSDKVLFASADYRLQKGGRELLDRCADLFSRAGMTGYQLIQVEGHTDNLPVRTRDTYPSNNWQLSAARAISVVEFLAGRKGLPSEVFSANGYASNRPVASNLTEQGRARNRRIEIRIFFSGSDAGTLEEMTAGGAHR